MARDYICLPVLAVVNLSPDWDTSGCMWIIYLSVVSAIEIFISRRLNIGEETSNEDISFDIQVLYVDESQSAIWGGAT